MIVSSESALDWIVSAKSRCCGVSVGVEQQPGHADDAVHRRADLVAHVGQELRLQAGRLERRVARARASSASIRLRSVMSRTTDADRRLAARRSSG